MTSAFVCFNSDGELTFSSEGWAMEYIGQATFLETVPSPTTRPGTNYEQSSGYSAYTIDWAGDRIMTGAVLGTTYESAYRQGVYSRTGNTWTIYVQKGNGSALNAAGFMTEAAPTIYCWGTPVSDVSVGVSVRNAAGSLVAKLPSALCEIRGRAHFAAGATSATIVGSFNAISGTTYPVILSAALGEQDAVVGNGGYGQVLWQQYIVRYWRSGTTLYRSMALQWELSSFEDYGVSSSSTAVFPEQTVFLTEAYRFLIA